MNMISSIEADKGVGNGLSSAPIAMKDLPAVIATWTDLPETKRRDLASASRRAYRLFDSQQQKLIQEGAKTRERTPVLMADCAQLNAFLFSREARVFGLSPRRLENIRSLVREVLRRLGLHAGRRVLSESALPAWQLPAAALVHTRNVLVPFAIWCSDRNILPDQVTPEVLRDYRFWRMANTLKASAARADRDVAVAWKALRKIEPSWPPMVGELPPVKPPYAVLLSDCPLTFQEDVERFRRRALCVDAGEIFALGCDDPATGASGRRRPARPATVEAQEFRIRQAVGALVQCGLPIEEIRSLRDLVHPLERPKQILEWFYKRSDRRQGSNIGNVAELLRQLARFHCQLPENECRQVSRWAASVRGDRSAGMIPKNRMRLRAVVEPSMKAVLLHCPEHLMKEAERLPPGSPMARLLARAALGIGILLVCPMRVGNLRQLRLGEHLRRSQAGSRFYTHFHVGEHETKNHAVIEWPIPEGTARLINRYLERHRHAAEGNDYLFPGENGIGVVAESTMNMTITKTAAKELGAEINPHLFRHFAAYLYLENNPGAYELVRRILGHKSIETTISFYCGLETEFAARHHDKNVLRQQKQTKAAAAVSFSRLRKGR